MALRSYAGGAVFAEGLGDGPPRVLALHGWGRRGADFRRSLDGLPALAVDLPGFGASPPPADVIGAEGYAEVVAGLLDELDGPPVLVGHSFGGRVAVCLAAARPDEVGPIVLTGAPLIRREGPKPALSYRLARSLHRLGAVSDERMERLRRNRGSADYRAAAGVMRDILVKVVNEQYPDKLRELRSEVLMLWGERDDQAPVAAAAEAASIINDAGGSCTLEVLAGVGHHVPLEAADDLRRVVGSALA